MHSPARSGRLPICGAQAAEPPVLMAYTFEVVAWEDWNMDRHRGVPRDPDAAHGVKVVVADPDDEGDTHQFWIFTLTHFQDWSEWYVYIGGMMASHGMELADE